MDKIRILCATVLACASLAAQAQSEDREFPGHPWHFGIQVGSVQDHDNANPVAQVSLGYDIDRTFAVEALANVSLLFMREGTLEQGNRIFDDAIGGRALASLPLSENWKLTGGVGVVRFEDEIGDAGRNVTFRKTSPMVSLSVMYRSNRRWNVGAEVASFTSAHATSVGLKGEFHF